MQNVFFLNKIISKYVRLCTFKAEEHKLNLRISKKNDRLTNKQSHRLFKIYRMSEILYI